MYIYYFPFIHTVKNSIFCLFLYMECETLVNKPGCRNWFLLTPYVFKALTDLAHSLVNRGVKSSLPIS